MDFRAPLVLEDPARLATGGKPLFLALGMFDGVHRGHQAVIGAAVAAARQAGGVAGVLTFWPHPSRVFQPEAPVAMITAPEHKAMLLGRAGVAAMVVVPFTREFAAMEAAAFPRWLKQQMPDLAGICIGENFRFGQGRRGDVELLIREDRDLGVEVVSAERLRYNGEPISSTRIRSALTAGDVTQANRMLGYPYFALGTAQPGRQNGRKLGFPTLNLAWQPECLPRFGVYAVRVCGMEAGLPDEAFFQCAPGAGRPGVANFGLRPTVGDLAAPLLEVHLLGGSTEWTTGSRLRVEWLHFLRPEKKFASLEALRAQIAQDRAGAEAIFR